MGKKSREKRERAPESEEGAAAPLPAPPDPGLAGSRGLGWRALLVALLAILLYANTLGHGFAYDDVLVITRNRIVQKGFAGFREILTEPYLKGYWETRFGGYRPLSLLLFATEWQLSPQDPGLGHKVNVLLYALTGALVVITLSRLLRGRPGAELIAFTAGVLFVAHPLHTEVVANIKSGDELLAAVLGLLCLLLLVRAERTGRWGGLVGSAACFFLALLAKESAVTLLAMVPLTLYFFAGSRPARCLRQTLPYVIATGGYLALRAAVLGGIMEERKPHAVIDNSLMSATDLLGRLASAMTVLGHYLRLLVWPHPLEWDYSYAAVPIVGASSPLAWLSALIHLALLAWALLRVRRRDVLAYGILFYLVTLSVVSNVFVLVQAAMAERFLYLPSLGFCLAIAVLLSRLAAGARHDPVTAQLRRSPALVGIVLLLAAAGSYATIKRNPVWRDNLTLFASASADSPSARVHYVYGRELVDLYMAMPPAEKGSEKGRALLDLAVSRLEKAVRIYPDYPQAYLSLANGYNFRGERERGLETLAVARRQEPQSPAIVANMAGINVELQRYDEAVQLFREAIAINPSYPSPYLTLAQILLKRQEPQEAISLLLRYVELVPDDPRPQRHLSRAYQAIGDLERAELHARKFQEATGAARR